MFSNEAVLLLLSLAVTSAQDPTATQPSTPTADLYAGLIMGVGKGTFAVFIFILFSILLCFFRHLFTYPFAVVVCAIVLPFIVFGFIYTMPTQDPDESSHKQLPTSWYMVKTGIFTAIISLVTLFSCCAILSQRIHAVQVRRIDSE